MAFCTLQYAGEAIQKAATMNVIVPDGPGPYPALYLLHGLGDDHSIWARRTSLERYVAELPLIVVMPDGARSFYCNDPRPAGLSWEDHIVRDVVGVVDRTFHTIPRRAGRAIAGLSMGGYGALMLACRHPDTFAVACSHSGALTFLHERVSDRPDVEAIAGFLKRSEYDVFRLVQRLAAGSLDVALRLDCGIRDFCLESNRQMHRRLATLKLVHEYAEYPGGHDWEYWDTHIRDTLGFVMRVFSGKTVACATRKV